MATLQIALRTASGNCRETVGWRLDLAALAAPVAGGGRDWLRLQGHAQAETAVAYAGWVESGSSPDDDLLRVELRAGNERCCWRGALQRRELLRIASRAAMARTAALLWPTWSRSRGDELKCWLAVDSGEPIAPALRPVEPACADRAAGGLGIRWRADPTPPAVPPPAPPTTTVRAWRIHGEPAGSSGATPDLVVAFRRASWTAVRALGAESAAAREERGLMLYGRRLRLRVGGEFVPWFEVAAVERPRHLEASAGSLVLEHQSLAARSDGAAFVGMLHTHLHGVGVEPSDNDRRDVEDLDHGGPAAVSIICEALPQSAAALPALAVLGRIARRGGRIDVANARVLIAEPARLALPNTPNTPDPEVSR
jgi:hypothetical protein